MLSTRKLVTGVAVCALALGLFFGQFMKFGVGTGGSVGVTSAPPATQTNAPSRSSSTSGQPAAKRADITGVEGDAQHMVLVRIAGKSYSIAEWQGNKADYRAATASEIARLATRKDGDAKGIKVRISRDDSSKASAEDALRKELEAAGVPPEAIQWDSGTGY